MTEQTNPTVRYVEITSATGIQDNWTNYGDIVYAIAVFDESVLVDNTSGNPTLTIVVGSDNRTATYAFRSNTTIDNDSVTFRYTIDSGDNDTNGISIDEDSIADNGSTIRDASGNYANITHSSVPDNSSYKVDTTDPTLLDNVSIIGATCNSPCDPPPGVGGTFSMQATFSENVTVTGSPKLVIVIDDEDKDATYASGNNTTALVFNYALVNGDKEDSDGISIGRDSLTLPTATDTIQDLAGNDATITHSPVGDNSSYKVK